MQRYDFQEVAGQCDLSGLLLYVVIVLLFVQRCSELALDAGDPLVNKPGGQGSGDVAPVQQVIEM